MKVASFFSGIGGLDKGFQNVGYEIVFANDNWSGCWQTYEYNQHLEMNKKSIEDITADEIPTVDGFIGGPPCQSWSLAGSMRGIKDPRGQLLYEYLRLIKQKKPKFFLMENVPGMVCKTHKDEFDKFTENLRTIGYTLHYQVLNASDYNVPQDRKRVFIVGFRNELEVNFKFPKPYKSKVTLRDAIGNMEEPLATQKDSIDEVELPLINHEYMLGDFSSMYMSRNRVRSWDEQSFTIQASGRHAPCHPQANKMIKVDKDKRIFDPSTPKPYRRLSVRECARIQTFDDDYKFFYKKINDGYKMIGNAVPVKLAEELAKAIKEALN
ncbi:MAG: DNA cytosine methyltransferase [Methanosphaera sp.]|uniref:DNA cytosine methyltransferase n=1 Tax=Methanosphaera sp. TaxID=2666342 RepID=UPI0025DD8A2A|nr:DNA cytosine methyltransferase [Methanosphaera sp.]MCI5866791.1 DNA cytosine methyltransferase [Methanosphaera sp.]MDD6534305.1 DNA cytosine methyltransferase [Methanosphaera sp.]MDY3956310.1 DNA cytosine methyltransferase [Methanosphaera sp.]